jgi:ribonuclease HI
MEIHPEETVVIYTDGSQIPKPRRGGFGVVVLWTTTTVGRTSPCMHRLATRG